MIYLSILLCVVDTLKRRVCQPGASFFTMVTHSDVQRVKDAFILKEILYWWFYPIERVQNVRGIVAWDGYHWTLARQMAQDGNWESLKASMDTMGETYLRQSMEHLVQSASRRLYHDYWTACLAEDENNPREQPNDHAFVKTGTG